ncbi:MAG: class B sortase [Bacilli bacterium]|nr:class B sortase [Bacilli bacterium]
MKKKKIKWKNIIFLFVIVILLVIFVVSLYKVFLGFKEKISNNNLIDNINSLVVIEESEDTSKDEIEVIEGSVEESFNYYYEYLKVPFMDVDYRKLREINEDVVGWINVVGAGINYPYVQTDNNDYYLEYSFDKTKNASGWVFLDYRNNSNILDKNTIIYAHGGNSLAMFGPLKRLYDKDEWFKNPDNHYIKISTDKYNYVFKVFSLYVIKTTNDYIKVDFSDGEYLKFLEKLKDRSYYDFETEIDELDKIITLSTCYNKKEKLVLHGKLIKEQKNG